MRRRLVAVLLAMVVVGMTMMLANGVALATLSAPQGESGGAVAWG